MGQLHQRPQGRALKMAGGRSNLPVVQAGTSKPPQYNKIALTFKEDIQISWVWVTSRECTGAMLGEETGALVGARSW